MTLESGVVAWQWLHNLVPSSSPTACGHAHAKQPLARCSLNFMRLYLMKAVVLTGGLMNFVQR